MRVEHIAECVAARAAPKDEVRATVKAWNVVAVRTAALLRGRRFCSRARLWASSAGAETGLVEVLPGRSVPTNGS